MKHEVVKNEEAWAELSNTRAMIRKWLPSSRRGKGFLILFYAVFLGFAFGTFYVSDCVPIPPYDTVVQVFNFDLNVRNLRGGLCSEEYDATHDLTLLLSLRGIIDPKKIYQPLFGFTCSYPNHIKSTSFKFTDIS